MVYKVAVTPGEPAGVGPDLLIQLAQQDWPVQLVAVADPELLKQRADNLNLPLQVTIYDSNSEPIAHKKGTMQVMPVQLHTACEPGVLNADNGAYVVETLRLACKGNMDGEFKAIVTGPVHKSLINQAGISFSGHTEYFAQQANCADVVMMLATPGLRVSLVTTHIPLAYVSTAITFERIQKILLKNFTELITT